MARSLICLCVLHLVGGNARLFAAEPEAPEELTSIIVELKSGDRLEGQLISQDHDTITVRCMLTPKIVDTRTLQKSDVRSVVIITPAQAAMRSLRLESLIPGADLMTVEDYDRIIRGPFSKFLKVHPNGPEAAQVKAMVTLLEQEKARAGAGEVKVEGEWIEAATAARNRHEIEAYRLRLAMKREMADAPGDSRIPSEIMALRQFEELKLKFPATLHHVKAIPEALAILESYDKRLKAMQLERPVMSDERRKLLQPPAGGPAQDLFLRKLPPTKEEREFKERYEQQVREGVKWRDVYAYDLTSLRAAQAMVAEEQRALTAIDIQSLRAENARLSEVMSCMAEGRVADARAMMDQLRPLKEVLINRKVFEELDAQLLGNPARGGR